MPSYWNDLENEDLALKAKGNPEALHQLVANCSELCYRIAKRVCKYTDDRDDAVSAMMVLLLEGGVIGRYDPKKGRLYSWLSAQFAAVAKGFNTESGRQMYVDTDFTMEDEEEDEDDNPPPTFGPGSPTILHMDPTELVIRHLTRRLPGVNRVADAVYIVADEGHLKSRKNVVAIQEKCGICRNSALQVYYVILTTLRMTLLGIPLPNTSCCLEGLGTEFTLVPEMRCVVAHRPDLFEAVFANCYLRIPVANKDTQHKVLQEVRRG